MKKIALSLIAALVCLISANAQTVIKNYPVSDFTSISANYIFAIEVTKGDTYSVNIEAPNSFFELIKVKKHDTNLDFTLKTELPKRLRDLSEKITVKITMPSLEGVELAGASKLSGNGVFATNGKRFKAELSGASKITDLCIETPSVDIEVDGASKVEMNVNTDKVKAELNGASKMTLTGNAPIIDMELSGASAADAKNINCDVMEIEASGASRALVFVQNTLKVDLSGASKCEYLGPEEVNVRIDGISGASSLRRIR